MRGWTGQAGHAGLMLSAWYPDYQLFLWTRMWWGFAFTFRVEDSSCKAARRDTGGELVTSSWCDMKRLLADEWCKRPVDAASWTGETGLAGALTQR